MARLLSCASCLYLQAEVSGLAGSVNGDYLDPQLDELLKMADSRGQSLYHFTIDRALVGERVRSLPTIGLNRLG